MRENSEKENITVRRETEADRDRVEQITREAFYNLYVPGCVEHYLAHVLRGHRDFVPELDLVLERDGRVIGSIMYTRAVLTDGAGAEKEVLTFGPVSVLPGFQRRGYGKLLMEDSFERARALGYEAIVIFGSPANYVGRGFKSCKKYCVRAEDGAYPAAMMVKELRPGALEGRSWVYRDSPALQIDEQEAQRFDDGLEKMEKKWQPSQEEFYILSHATLQ